MNLRLELARLPGGTHRCVAGLGFVFHFLSLSCVSMYWYADHIASLRSSQGQELVDGSSISWFTALV